MKTTEELNALKEEVETVSKKLAELTEENLAQVNGGNNPGVKVLTDEVIKSGRFLVSITGFWYKGEFYQTKGEFGLMAIFISPTGKQLLIPQKNIL